LEGCVTTTEESIGLGHDLVGHQNQRIVHIGEPHQFMQMSVKFLLTIGQGASAYVFCPEMSGTESTTNSLTG